MATHEDISVSTVDQQTELKCDICYKIPDHEWKIRGFGCCNGKFCKECIDKMLDSKDCPMCRTEKPVNVRTGNESNDWDSFSQGLGDISFSSITIGEGCEIMGCSSEIRERYGGGRCPRCSYGDCRKHCATWKLYPHGSNGFLDFAVEDCMEFCHLHAELCTNCNTRHGEFVTFEGERVNDVCQKCCFIVKCKINCEELRQSGGRKWLTLSRKFSSKDETISSPKVRAWLGGNHKIAFCLKRPYSTSTYRDTAGSRIPVHPNPEIGPLFESPGASVPTDFETIRELRKYCTEQNLLVDLTDVYPQWRSRHLSHGLYQKFPKQGEMSTYPYLSDKARIKVKAKKKK